jgi:hypothetical protein
MGILESKPMDPQQGAVVSNVDERKISAEELAKHDCWIAISGIVYDISKFMNAHPGGPETLTPYLGADGTRAFQDVGVCSMLPTCPCPFHTVCVQVIPRPPFPVPSEPILL